MPRHLRAAVAALSAWPEDDQDRWHPLDVPPAWTRLVEYFECARGWHLLGLELDPELCKEIAGLAARRADLREVLFHLIGFYPCAAFRRILHRNVAQEGGGDFVGWLAAFPELEDGLRSAVVARAERFHHAYQAVQACLIWARYFDGGDAAWRQLACVIKREDRKQARRVAANDYVRHDLETHGTVTLEEARKINQFLDELDGTRLWDEWAARSSPPDAWRQESYRGRALEHAVRGCQTFAGDDWSAEDVELFAGVLARMSPVQRSSYRMDAVPQGCSEALREVAERAQAVGHTVTS